jgi:hypothetical protein
MAVSFPEPSDFDLARDLGDDEMDEFGRFVGREADHYVHDSQIHIGGRGGG